MGVDEAFLNVEPPSAEVTGKQPSGKRKKASGKGSAEGNTEASGEDTTDPSEFSLKNFVQAVKILAKSMKEKREYLLSLNHLS